MKTKEMGIQGTGMPAVDPNLLKNQAANMSRMNERDINNMKNAAASQAAQFQHYKPPEPPRPNPTQSPPKRSNTTDSHSFIETSGKKYSKAESLKEQGNAAFRKGDYEGAGRHYLEAFMEIDICKESLLSGASEVPKDLQALEISCHLNYANVKAKLSEWEPVLSHARDVLAIDKQNGKGLFRLGQAYFHIGKYELARAKLQEAQKILPTDQAGKKKTK